METQIAELNRQHVQAQQRLQTLLVQQKRQHDQLQLLEDDMAGGVKMERKTEQSTATPHLAHVSKGSCFQVVLFDCQFGICDHFSLSCQNGKEVDCRFDIQHHYGIWIWKPQMLLLRCMFLHSSIQKSFTPDFGTHLSKWSQILEGQAVTSLLWYPLPNWPWIMKQQSAVQLKLLFCCFWSIWVACGSVGCVHPADQPLSIGPSIWPSCMAKTLAFDIWNQSCSSSRPVSCPLSASLSCVI